MMRFNDYIYGEEPKRREPGILYINIYPVLDYPKKIKVSQLSYNGSFSPGKWRKRIGNKVFYYGNNIKDDFQEICIDNPIFGMIFRKYLLDMLSENVETPWQLKELKSNLRIFKEITKRYDHSDKIELQYELIINIHHWQNTNFGVITDLKINIIDRKNNKRISYKEIESKYGENVRRSIWVSVQTFHKHLTAEGKRYPTAMRDKFNLITALLKEAFAVSTDKRYFRTYDGEVKISFKPFEIIKVTNYGI